MGSKEFAPVRMETATAGGYFMNRPEQIISQPIVSLRITEEILNETVRECRKNGSLVTSLMDAFDTTSKTLSIFNGSVNLVNEVFEQNKKGNDIRALLFLDKSARNGAYIFRLFWKELKDRGEIPTDMTFPEIRFINIGRDEGEKLRSRSARALLKETFNEFNVDRKVIVVDEFADTGNSLKRAMEFVRSLYGVETKGFQLYSMCPYWYGHTPVFLGVRDLSLSSDLRKGFNDLDSETAAKLFGFFKKINRDDFIDFISKFYNGVFGGYLEIPSVKGGLNHGEVVDLCQILFSKNLLPDRTNLEIDNDNIWDYITSVAGYLSIPLRDKELIRQHCQCRQMFDVLVKKYMEKIDKIRKN